MTAALPPTSDFLSAFNDPLFEKMESGEYLWGDLMMDVPSVPRSYAADPAPSMPEDWDLEFPVLRLRKNIWEYFPVNVTPLGAGKDGAERHAITWHRKNFEEWRDERTEDGYEAMDYFNITLYRLEKCLEASKFWTVEPPRTDSEICVIRMNFVPRTETVETDEVVAEVSPANAGAGKAVEEDDWVTVAPKAAPAKPTLLLTRLNDIKTHFPVVWHKIEDAHTRTAVYALELFSKKLKEMSAAAGKDVRSEVEVALMAALRQSTAWRVLRSEGREFCRLEMA